jgi:hypothetical protein
MDLERHVNALREQLALAAEAGDDEARDLARRLIASLDAAVRLTLLEVLADAAAEITGELAPGSVDLRLRGGEPEFVVAASPADAAPESEPSPVDAGDGATARINLRLPDQLKDRIEQAAEREGLSINSWLVRAVAAVVDRGTAGATRSSRTYTGWGR